MEPTRITMLAPFGIRPKGTLIARMLPLAQALTAVGMQCVIVAPPIHNPQDAGSSGDHGGVIVTHTPVARMPGPLGVVELAWAMVAATRATRPDVVYLFKPKGHAGLAAAWYRRLFPQTALVVDCDDREGTGGWNDVLAYPRPARWLFDWQERTLPRRADAVTVASRTLQSLCWADGCTSDAVWYVPNAADLERAPTVAADTAVPRLVLYTRFWEFDSGAVVAVLAAVCARHATVVCDVIGSGENGEETVFAAACAAAGIDTRVVMHGWQQPDAIPALLAQAVIAVVPVRDTLINRARCSAKLLELLAAGLAVVGNDVGETRAFVQHGANGMLVPPDDPVAFADAIVALLDDPTLLAQLRAGARVSAHTQRWEQRVPAVRAALAQAVIAASSRGGR